MIILHRLGRPHNAFALNRDLIVSVEARPDTVITLTSGDKLLVREKPDEVIGLVQEGRVKVLAQALARRGEERSPRSHSHGLLRQPPDVPLTVVEAIDRPGGRRPT